MTGRGALSARCGVTTHRMRRCANQPTLPCSPLYLGRFLCVCVCTVSPARRARQPRLLVLLMLPLVYVPHTHAASWVSTHTESLQGVVRGVVTTKVVVTTQGGVVTTPNTHFFHVFWGYNLTTPLLRPFSGRRILFKCPLHTARCHARCDF